MRLKDHRWLFLAFCFLLSCGKERTLNVNERWSIDPPLSQVQNSPIQIELKRNFSADGNSEAKLSIQLSGEAATKHSKLNVSVANQNFGIGESAIDFISLINQDMKIEESGAVLLSMRVPQRFFLSVPSQDNKRICFRNIITGSPIQWDDIQQGMFSISIDSYSTQSSDAGSWTPEFDLVQTLYPGTNPNSDPSQLADKSVTVTLLRSHSALINQIPVTISVKESFPSNISFNCGS